MRLRVHISEANLVSKVKNKLEQIFSRKFSQYLFFPRVFFGFNSALNFFRLKPNWSRPERNEMKWNCQKAFFCCDFLKSSNFCFNFYFDLKPSVTSLKLSGEQLEIENFDLKPKQLLLWLWLWSKSAFPVQNSIWFNLEFFGAISDFLAKFCSIALVIIYYYLQYIRTVYQLTCLLTFKI